MLVPAHGQYTALTSFASRLSREWIKKEVTADNLADASNLKGIQKRLIHKEGLPDFEVQQLKLDDLIEQGERLVFEVRCMVSCSCAPNHEECVLWPD